MLPKNLIKKLLILIHGTVICLALLGIFGAADGSDDKITFSITSATSGNEKLEHIKPIWENVETDYAIIRYQNAKELKRFDRKIHYSPGGLSLKNLFSGPAARDPTGSIKKKVDALYERVQEILDMRKRTNKVVIYLYPSKKRMREAYRRIIGTKCNIRAMYIFESNSIYINTDDVNEGMLAHEMAHAIIDHYLTVRPPQATAEILARYVDKHLNF